MFLRVEIATPGQGMQKIKLDGPEITLGRDPACQVPFDAKEHSAVSWHHARVEIATNGAVVSDLGSSNGTFVNGTQLTGKKSLQQGDVIGLGQTGPKVRVVEVVTFAPSAVPQTIAEKMLPHGMLTPPVGSKPINLSSDNLPARPAALKRRRLQIGGLILGLLAFGTVVTAGYIVFSQPKTDEKKDEAGDKKKDEQQAKVDGTPEKKGDGKADPDGANTGKKNTTPNTPDQPPKTDPGTGKTPATASTGSEIYKKTLQSIGWVNARTARGIGEGTGSLVDKERRLFLTAYHVIAGATEGEIYFPRYDNDGRAVSDPKHYLRNERPVIGEIVAIDTKKDLAILRLQSVPASVLELPLAAKGVEIADRVYTVGNPAVSSALWVYTEGSVRQIVFRKFKLDNKQDMEAWIVEAQFPINPGDSGGPVVNDRSEIVGVNCSRRDLNVASLMSNFVELREIQVVLDKARKYPKTPTPFKPFDKSP